MKKTLSIFAIAGITLVSACGPSAEELAKKEQATKDSIAAVEKARQDSLELATMKAQMTADSIANAAAINDDASKSSTPNKPAVKKDEPKLTQEEKTENAMTGRRGGATSTTPADAKKVEETKDKMQGRRGGK